MSSLQVAPHASRASTLGWVSVMLIAVIGLAHVKWIPYYQRAHVAVATHSIGTSILTGKDTRAPEPSFSAARDYAMAYGKAIWKAMALGLLLGSGIQTLLPRRWIARALGRSDFARVVLGGALSLPSMMCTCCAAPVVAGLRDCRAAPGSAVAFWLGNTVLNPATLMFTAFVLGRDWLTLRLVAGLVMVVGLGWIANRGAVGDSVRVDPDSLPNQEEDRPSFARWPKALWQMSARLIPEYVLLVLLLGATRAWLFPHIGHEVSNSVAWIFAFALAGAAFVIPTAGEVPIVQTMRALGVGVGPAAALLMTLPPISLPSVAMLWRSLGPRTLALVSAGVILVGVASGIAATLLLS